MPELNLLTYVLHVNSVQIYNMIRLNYTHKLYSTPNSDSNKTMVRRYISIDLLFTCNIWINVSDPAI